MIARTLVLVGILATALLPLNAAARDYTTCGYGPLSETCVTSPVCVQRCPRDPYCFDVYREIDAGVVRVVMTNSCTFEVYPTLP